MRYIINKVYLISILLITTLITSGCYQTRNIPEDEYLYAGIKDIAYGHRWGEKTKKNNDSTGVITAMGNAYNAVQEVLHAMLLLCKIRISAFSAKKSKTVLNYRKI
jgi:hypothetical protein